VGWSPRTSNRATRRNSDVNHLNDVIHLDDVNDVEAATMPVRVGILQEQLPSFSSSACGRGGPQV